MNQDLVHFFLVGALLAVGVYLLGHPKVLSGKSRLFRGVLIWVGLVLGLRVLDYLFLT